MNELEKKIANVLIWNSDVYENEYFISNLCEVFENDNPSFNRDTFNHYIKIRIYCNKNIRNIF